ncbi:LuxR family transcriptional regulator [Jannaschia sp. W003]|uniref:LuxR family transcriptional regulator n=1 Tax=Jannaschia sp. W003 TaxID=2867012 RepID=UPI0021A4E4FF|nr:LuxR family transcriptional regulator [Jannaschia sp. W003]UWQ20481.1 LuxR family transcriptional regulator [Jannaschia sp. W003]
MTLPSEVLRGLIADETVDAVWSRLEAYTAAFGFDRMLYAASHYLTLHSAGDARDALILTNYPTSYTDEYVGAGLFQKAPLVRWAMNEIGTTSWRRVAEDARAGLLSADELEVVAFNQRHGVVAGYAISFPRSSPRAGAGLGLSSATMSQDEIDALWARHGEEIELVAGVAHLKLLSLPHGDHVRSLTKRQREVLELVSDGKTVQDAAVLLEINAATVEKHLRLAREALGVETTAQAIRKMSTHNQFFTYHPDHVSR